MTLPQTLLTELAALFGDRLSTAQAVREQHGKDESHFPSCPPEAVVFAQSTEEVAAAVKACAAHGVPVIAFGTGTSLEGHVAALKGGLCIDVTAMNAVLEVRAEDLDVTVQPGVTRKQLNEYLRDSGLFFPHRPRRRRLSGRHGGHPGFGHQRGPLRHHARERAVAGGGAA